MVWRRSQSFDGTYPMLHNSDNNIQEKISHLYLKQVGLDAAGKTTILYKMKLGEVVQTTPTIGKYYHPMALQVNLLLILRHVFRVQRGNSRIQKSQVLSLGCWWSGQGTVFSSEALFFNRLLRLKLRPI